MLRKLTKSSYVKMRWLGGSTTQLAIWPENSVYSDGDFLWRISSATVDLGESDFTALAGYERFIMTLDNSVMLTHGGAETVKLPPFAVHEFDGDVPTHSVGRCTNFNLAVKKDEASGEMFCVSSESRSKSFGIELTRGEMLVIHMLSGKGGLYSSTESAALSAAETAIFEPVREEMTTFKLSENSRAVVCVIGKAGK